jgi:hypothetical protein
MALEYSVALGMEPSDIFLELERETISKHDLLLGHAVLMSFDHFDRTYSMTSPGNSIAGFSVETSGYLLIIQNPYGSLGEGIVEEAINEMHPDHKPAFTNTSVDYGDYGTIRGIHANKLIEHPYIRACFGFTRGEESRSELTSTRMMARMAALDMLELPRPGDETMKLMFATMKHNTPRFTDEFKRLTGQDRKLEYPTENIASIAMLSKKEMRRMAGSDVKRLLQRRLNFVSRHPGSEALFSPFAPEDKLLSEMRYMVQMSLNMMQIDGEIEERIGSDLWEEFVADPKRFCDARIEPPVPVHDDDGPSF